MKIRFAKILAIACVLCMTFASLTALAVEVTTITDYNYLASQETPTLTMTIETEVTGLDEAGEVTYYVENAGGVIYIDQETADANGEVNFKFKAPTNEMLTATAKHGSDKGYSFPAAFSFKEGCNRITQGLATATKVDANWAILVPDAVVEDYEVEEDAYIFQAQVSGNVKAYGIKITINGAETFLPAMGCDVDGTYAIVARGITAEEAGTAVAYAE